MNSKRNILKYIIIKLTKIRDKEKIFKTSKRKATNNNNIQGNTYNLMNTFFFQQKFCISKESGMIYLKWWKGQMYNREYSTQQGSHSDLIDKSFPDKKIKENSAEPNQAYNNYWMNFLVRKEKDTTRKKKITNVKAHC